MNHEFTIDPPTETNVLGDNHDGSSDNGYHPQLLLDLGNCSFAQDNETFNMGQLGQTFGMDEPLIYGAQNVTPSTSISSNQRDFPEDAFKFANVDSMVQNLSALQQELGMDYNGRFQSLVLDQVNHNQADEHRLSSHDIVGPGGGSHLRLDEDSQHEGNRPNRSGREVIGDGRGLLLKRTIGISALASDGGEVAQGAATRVGQVEQVA
ncbi:hypothetical protein Pfo_005475 [Paulownia fortunei]|nr:hypothetical protein Pfo_005475 [Paulownia fortunei]